MIQPVPHRLIAACVSVGLMTVSSSLLQAGATNATSSQLSQTSPKCDLDPRSYGAKGDGVTFDTQALQKAIDLCAGTGGRVVLYSGTYLTKPLELRGKMTLRLEKGAVLLGSPDIADYSPRLPEGFPVKELCRSLLRSRYGFVGPILFRPAYAGVWPPLGASIRCRRLLAGGGKHIRRLPRRHA